MRHATPLRAFLALAAAWCAAACGPPDTGPAKAYVATPQADATSADARLALAFERHERDLQVAGAGTVARLLADDRDGSRHQRFILRLASGQTLLVAHNIDLAPRVGGLAVGDRVEFFGEYEWSEKGGVIHWTHHDPDGRHAGGWLRHEGRVFR